MERLTKSNEFVHLVTQELRMDALMMSLNANRKDTAAARAAADRERAENKAMMQVRKGQTSGSRGFSGRRPPPSGRRCQVWN
eukprot:1195300-Prorocentrum_minimum.AAC.9